MKERGQSKDSDGLGHGRVIGHGTDGRTIRDSMEYYRVWIYSSNAVLGITSAIFIVFGAFVMADARLSLLRDVEMYHPTFLYAYVALLLQCGLIQVIGCLGAKNLSEKLLSLYWASLLLLTLGDIVVGLFWVFKLDAIKTNLKGRLGQDFITKYSVDPQFTEIWNRLQADDHCCGVNGPQDFNLLLSSIPVKTPAGENGDLEGHAPMSLPDSCCTLRVQHISTQPTTNRKKRTEISSLRKKRNRIDSLSSSSSSSSDQHVRHFIHKNKVPPINLTSSTETSPIEKISEEEVTDAPVPFLCRHLPKHGVLSELLGMTTAPELTFQFQADESGGGGLDEPRHRVRHIDGSKPPPSQISFRARNRVRVYRNGCAHKMLEWIEWVSGVLAILGFCILGFSKFCFLIILRREIKEMIEKIQILRKEVTVPPPGTVLAPPGYNNGKARNSIHKQYSTQSGAMSTVSGVSVTGITIKSPQYFSTLTYPANHHAPRMSIHCDHYAHLVHHDHHHHQARRHSARSLGGTDASLFQGHRKSQSQSQETVHLSLLISNHKNSDTKERFGEESISFKVPTPEERECKRALWANQSPMELNVSGDSSVSGPVGFDPASPPGTIYSQSSNSPAPTRRQELVEVDLEKGPPLSNASSMEEPVNAPALSTPELKRDELVEQVPLFEPSPTPSHLTPYNFNGNNNLDKLEIDPDSDFVMALIGTPV